LTSELHVLCVKCRAIAVFKNIDIDKKSLKLYDDAGHFLGTVGEVLEMKAQYA